MTREETTLDHVSSHVPVLLEEMMDHLQVGPQKTYIDGTFGRGGYTQAILQKNPAFVWAIDRDPQTYETAQDLEQSYPQQFQLLAGCFGDMAQLLARQDVIQVDGIVLDIGVSSMQIDTPARGFSFRHLGPLDMRMSQRGRSAEEVVNTLPEEELAHIIYTWGEERFSRAIARKIVQVRAKQPLKTTQDLADVVRSVVRRHRDGIDPATRTFQALRIFVNDELGELQRGLEAATHLLKPGGRLVIVCFQSLEDRCVKNFFRTHSQQATPLSRYQPMPLTTSGPQPIFELITRRAVTASPLEVTINPRARSAKLRAVQRTNVPVMPREENAL